VVSEPLHTRKYYPGVPYNLGGRLMFVTPNKFLRIDELVNKGSMVDPLSIL
jgi:hypothetical protein